MKKLIILAVLFLCSCNRYISPERAANPKHRYIIRTTKGERQMTRLIRRSTFYRSKEGCGYKK
jgi:hypothetical protein